MTRGLVVATIAVAAAAGCRDPAATHERAAPPLATTLEAAITAHDRDAIVAGWRLERAGWARSTVDPYRAAYDAYVHAFDAARPRWVAQLARGGAVATRAHYAGDARLTVGQARARWALPVQHPAEVAELDGAPLDAVFVRDHGQWRALVGLDAIVRAAVEAIAPACAAHLAAPRTGRCADLGWVIADAALRGDAKRAGRACRLADGLCPK